MSVSRPQYAEIQRVFATKSPVLAIGPGCHRVGYDQTKGWEEVHRRATLLWYQFEVLRGSPTGVMPDAKVADTQRFLSLLWESKLSTEARGARRTGTGASDADNFGLPLDGDLASPDPQTWCAVDRVRTVLATLILVAVRDATQVLGTVIATGRYPVSSWREVGQGSRDEGLRRIETTDTRSSATEALRCAADIAEFAQRLAAGEPPNESWRTAEELGLQDLSLTDITADEDFANAGLLLKLGPVSGSLRTLYRNYFAPGHEVTGGMIEWLGDLLWHVLVIGSRVPPSVNELAFYLNLSEAPDLARRAFSRTVPGEVTGLLDHQQTHDEIRELLSSYDSGSKKWSDISEDRKLLVRSLAATHLTAWQKAAERRDGRGNKPPVPVALVSDYDLSIERAILEMLDVKEALHVVLPAWVGTSGDLEWLWTTIRRKDKHEVRESDLTTPDASAWRQFHYVPGWLEEGDDQAVEGPIVVKLHGSPLMNLSENAQHRLKNPPSDEGQQLSGLPRLATIFTEYDALKAMVSFTSRPPHNRSKVLWSDIVERLTWSERSWIMLGERFPDWLPRVRLLLSARAHGGRKSDSQDGESDTVPVHIAIDRAFDWPERALLSALDVKAYETDLSRLAGYATQPTTASKEEKVGAFLESVAAFVRGAR